MRLVVKGVQEKPAEDRRLIDRTPTDRRPSSTMDSEMAALHIKQLDLSSALTKQLRTLKIERMGQLQEKGPAELADLGLSVGSLVEIARAFKDLDIPWAAEAEVRGSAAGDVEPTRPALPKWLLKHERITWVLDGFVPPRKPASEKCPRCGKPMTLIAALDLGAFSSAGLPKKSVFALRCENTTECSIGDAKNGPVTQVRVENSGGDRPKGHREYDYPDLFDAGRLGKSSDRVDGMLMDQREELGNGPRIGGWPAWGQCQYAIKGWPKCGKCSNELVLAFECAHDEDREHVLVCPSESCGGEGLMVISSL